MSPESTVGRNYVDWMLRCRGPSGPMTCSMSSTRGGVLDEDHYGLDEVKDRILDHIAVLALVGQLEGPILCLVGPPGVGQDVARPFHRPRARS